MRNIKKFDQFNEGLFDFIGRNKRGRDILNMIEDLSPEDISMEDNSPLEITYSFSTDRVIDVTKFLREKMYFILANGEKLNIPQDISKSIYDRLVEIKG